MVAVDVGVGHQHDLVVAQLVEVELLVDAGAERGDDRLHLGVGQHLVDARLLDVEDLAADREDRLDPRVAALPGRAAGRVALDDEDLALLGVGRLAVRQLAGQAAAAEQALAGAGQVARLARGDPGADAAACDLRTMSLPSAGFCSSQAPSWSLTIRCTKPLASVLPSLVLVWPSNCGSPSLIEMIAVRPSRMSSPETRSSRFLIRPHSSPQWLTRRGERGAEALLVGAALVGVDGVGEGVHRLGERGVPLHRDLEAHVALGRRRAVSASKEMTVGLALSLRAVEVLDVVDQAAVVLEDLLERRRPRPRWIASAPAWSTSSATVSSCDRVGDLVGRAAARRGPRSRGPC